MRSVNNFCDSFAIFKDANRILSVLSEAYYQEKCDEKTFFEGDFANFFVSKYAFYRSINMPKKEAEDRSLVDTIREFSGLGGGSLPVYFS